MINMKTVIYTLLIFFIVCMVLIETMILHYSKDNYNKNADYIIILGAKLHGSRPSNSLKYRMDVAIDKLKKYPNVKVIATGGQGYDEDMSEGEAIKKYLCENGIDRDRIIVEDKSTNTYENFNFAKKLIPHNSKLIKINIASNRYHLLRASMLAKRNGFQPYNIPAKTPKKVLLNSYFRESFALVKSFLLDRKDIKS